MLIDSLNEFFFGEIEGEQALRYSRIAASLLLITFSYHKPFLAQSILVGLFLSSGKFPFVAGAVAYFFFRHHGLAMMDARYTQYQGVGGLGFYFFCTFFLGYFKKPTTWAVRLMQIQIIFIYTGCVFNRLYVCPAWRNGDALFLFLSNHTFCPWHWPAFCYHAWVYKSLSYYSLMAEATFPLLSFIRKLRQWMVFLMVTFHISIALCMPDVMLFTLSIIPGLLLFLCTKKSGPKQCALTLC